MKKKLLLSLLTCCVTHAYLFSQVSSDYYNSENRNPGYILPPMVITPQTADIMRFDNTPINLNAGRVDLNIPLIDWGDRDFDLPISILYNSAGFKPAEPDNYVGRNWSLNCAGMVCREVNGVPDDISSQNVNGFFVKGFLTILKSHRNTLKKSQIKTDIFVNPYKYAEIKGSSSVSTIRSLPNTSNSAIECSADLFRFTFGEYSGKFMINFDGSISSVTTSGGECTINLDNYDLVNKFYSHNATISITTDNGYTYRFGGNDTYAPMEYTPLSWAWSYVFPGYYQSSGHVITTYHLTEVVAPNGRKLKIAYKDIPMEYHSDPHLLSPGYGCKPLLDAKINLLYSYSGCPNYDGSVALLYEGSKYPQNVPDRHLTKIALIDYIETDGAKVQFYYSVRDKHVSYVMPGRETSDAEFPYQCGAKLDSVIYKASSSGTIETTRLKYMYACGNRMFLTSVQSSKRGTHRFDYTIPQISGAEPMTTNIDHWGYWLGSGVKSQLFPLLIRKADEEIYYDYFIESDDRKPRGKDCEATLINKITYPTGGYATFEYEPHEYSQWLSRREGRAFIPTMDFPAGVHHAIAGGARIKNIKYYNNNGTLSKQSSYQYTDVSPLVSGELMYMPYYQYHHWRTINNVRAMRNYVCGAYGLLPATYAADHVRYPYVREKQIDYSIPAGNQSNGYTEYAFTSYNTNPDRFPSQYGQDPYAFGTFGEGFSTIPKTLDNPGDAVYNANLVMRPSLNASIERGKLLSEKVFSTDRKLLKNTEYKYERIIRDTCMYMYASSVRLLMATNLYTHIGLEQFYKYLPIEKKTTEYASEKDYIGNTRINNYQYNTDGYLISEQFVRGEKETIETTYSYSHKRLVPPDKNTYILKGAAREKIYEETYESDAMQLGYWKVKKVNIGDGTKSETRVEYVKYDKRGNPAHIITDGLYSTVYIWGYYGQYLIAKIENATYDEVAAALGESPENYTDSTYPVMLPLNQLREKLPNAMVSTYTHLPYIGMYTSVDPAGNTLKYRYDNAGRLTETWRVSDKEVSTLLQVNNYHLINQ